MPTTDAIAAEALPWAATAGIEAHVPHGALGSFRDDARVDFGRLIDLTPVVFRPRDRDQLIACVRWLAAHHVPWKARGAGHCSGGQALLGDGAVIDTRHLDRIVVDDPAHHAIAVEGGAWWLDVVRHLRTHGHRPEVLTDNLRTSLAGTLAVGGFGDRSHVAGLQIESVTHLVLVTADGETRRVTPGDALFGAWLAGGGRLGALAEVGLRTIARGNSLAGSLIEWDDLGRFVDDAVRIRGDQRFDFLRVTRDWRRGVIAAIAANFRDDARDDADRAALHGLRPARVLPLPPSDRIAHAEETDPIERWTYACPALELVFPLPDGLDALESVAASVEATGLARHLPLGSAMVVFATPPDAATRFPLAPYPRAPLGVMMVLRPQLPDRAAALRWLPTLRRIAREAVDAGARIYDVSIDTGAVAIDPRLAAWTAAVDPHGLCRSGLRPVLSPAP